MAPDVLYIHPAKQEVEAQYDKHIPSPPYLVLSISIGVAAIAMLCTIAFFFWRDWTRH